MWFLFIFFSLIFNSCESVVEDNLPQPQNTQAPEPEVLPKTFLEKGRFCYKHLDQCSLDKNVLEIEQLMAYFYELGKKKNQGKDFEHNSFLIADNNKILLEKLKRFVRSKYNGDMCAELMAAKTMAYPRKSTHYNDFYALQYKNQKKPCELTHYGIDLKNLPIANHYHLLFGNVGKIKDTNYIFIKLEPVGLRGEDNIKHLGDLITTRASRFFPKFMYKLSSKFKSADELEKKLKSEVDALLAPKFFLERKERIPFQYIEYFLLLAKKSGLAKNHTEAEQLFTRAEALGIKFIVETLEKTKYRAALQFAEALKNRFKEDYFIRFGHEIILQSSDLNS